MREKLGEPDDTVLIGFVNEDIYISSMDWRFAFRYGDGYSNVLSTCRMNPATLEERPDAELTHLRLRKLITRNIALHYGVPLSDHPRSVVYRSILAIADLDRMTEDF